MTDQMTDLPKGSGCCYEESAALVADDPTLRLVRGWYHCPMWGQREHWWVTRSDGSILDPTVDQFPTRGNGAEYVEYTGTMPCEYCGKDVPEADMYVLDGGHVYCSGLGAGRDVGLL